MDSSDNDESSKRRDTNTFAFIEQFSFGTLVSQNLEASHLPFILKRTKATEHTGTLYTHFARANPHWQNLDQQEVLIIFSGPHAYISPTWYAKGPAVPTWNYAAVHVKGTLSLLPASELPTLLDATLNTFEPSLLDKRDIVTQEFQDKLAKAIVGCKIDITHIEGKLKLGQNRSADDQKGVYEKLGGAAGKTQPSFEELDALQLHFFMQQCNLGRGT